MTENDMHGVNVAVDEAKALMAKMDPETHNAPFVAATAMAWGMLRAIMECPNCREHGEQHFCEPCIGYEESWEYIGCRTCGHFYHMDWSKLGTSDKAEKPKRKARRATRDKAMADETSGTSHQPRLDGSAAGSDAPLFAEVTAGDAGRNE